MTGAATAEPTRSILLGECSEDLQFEVCAQRMTPVASVEIHDIRHVTPRLFDVCNSRAFLDFALSPRPGEAASHFPDVRGHRSHHRGDMMFIPAHLRWCGHWNGGRQRSICVLFSEDEDWPDCQWTPAQLDAVLDLRHGHLRETMMRLAGELEHPGFESALMIEAMCRQIAILLRRHVDAPARWAGPGGRLAARQLRAVEDMLDCDGPVPSLIEFAALCGLSPRHFGRLFRLTTGQSFSEYAIARRIDRAKSMLADTGVPIKQVAWGCGFQTAAAFSVAFRRETGLQPTAYRSMRRS